MICAWLSFLRRCHDLGGSCPSAKKSYAIDYYIPQGGAPVWFDTMAIPKSANNVKEAHAFINYIETPEVHAAITDTMFYPNANKDAREFVVKEVADNPMIYPFARSLQDFICHQTAAIESAAFANAHVG